MHPRSTTIHLRCSRDQADFLYYELLGLLEDYRSSRINPLDDAREADLLDAIDQLKTGLVRSNAVAELRLANLRATVQHSGRRIAATKG